MKNYNHLHEEYTKAKSVVALTSSDIEKKRLELSGLEGRLVREYKELSLAESSLNTSLKRKLRYQKKILDIADTALKEKDYETIIQTLENSVTHILLFSCQEFVRKRRAVQGDYDAVYKLGEEIAKDVEYTQEDLQKLSQKISKRHDSSLGFYLSALVNKIIPKGVGAKITLNLNTDLDGVGAYLEDATLNVIGNVRNLAGYRMRKYAKLNVSGSAGDGLGFGLEGGKIKVKKDVSCMFLARAMKDGKIIYYGSVVCGIASVEEVKAMLANNLPLTETHSLGVSAKGTVILPGKYGVRSLFHLP